MTGIECLFDKLVLLALVQTDQLESCHHDLGALAIRPRGLLPLCRVWEASWARGAVTYPQAQTKVTEGRRLALIYLNVAFLPLRFPKFLS